MQKPWRCFALAISLVSGLLGCATKNYEEENQQQLSDHKKHEAAKYNTQLGLGYLQQGDQPRAKRKFLLALKLEPNSPEVNAAMAYFFEKTNDLEEARVYYKKALSLAPQSGSQKNNYGTFLCRTGHYPEAMKLLMEAAHDTHYDNSSMAYENAGLCAEMLHDDVASMNYFSRALEQDRHRKLSLYEYVKLAQANHQSEQAMKQLERYAYLTKSDPELLKLAIQVAHTLGRQEKVTEYEQQLNFIHAGGTHS
jgi:type IV pilus assembly protein PilF